MVHTVLGYMVIVKISVGCFQSKNKYTKIGTKLHDWQYLKFIREYNNLYKLKELSKFKQKSIHTLTYPKNKIYLIFFHFDV